MVDVDEELEEADQEMSGGLFASIADAFADDDE